MAELTLTVRLNPSAADARRGITRIHPEALAALGLREWDAVALIGARPTASVAGKAPSGTPTGTVLLDDVTMSNTGLTENSSVVVRPVPVQGAKSATLRGSTMAHNSLSGALLRQALLGKVLTVGDTVSLLPRDLGPGSGTSETAAKLGRTFGFGTWTTELLTVAATDPAGAISIQPNTAVEWDDPSHPATAPAAVVFSAEAETEPERAAMAPSELVGVSGQVAKLTEWLSLALDEPELLKKLGASAHLGVLVTGPAGVGKVTVARAVLAGRPVVELDGPSTGALAADSRLERVNAAIAQANSGGVLLFTDVDALLGQPAEPVAALILDALRAALRRPGVALVATSAHPESLDPRLRDPELCDRELTIPLPDGGIRRGLLDSLLRDVPTDDIDLAAIASRTPGFVAADLAALCREAALRAASRARKAAKESEEEGKEPEPRITQDDLTGALGVIRPLSRSGTEEVAVGAVTLDDVGDMAETKQALTEAVLWPLQHPDSFARLGVDPPRGVLLYGPPGCGKTFLVRALASSGQLSVHSVKGAELMDKWVGASEKAVRELFQRARDSAPSLVFLDEVDALAPRRGQASDSGVADRVVAALLTELDGAEPLRDVVVLGATNRPDLIDPALLRPGRLERLVFVPPPDADARAAILATSAKSVPLADDIELPKLAIELEGYSAADCAALLREAALAAMRRNIDAAIVTADDVAEAREAVHPSLDPYQVAALAAYAQER